MALSCRSIAATRDYFSAHNHSTSIEHIRQIIFCFSHFSKVLNLLYNKTLGSISLMWTRKLTGQKLNTQKRGQSSGDETQLISVLTILEPVSQSVAYLSQELYSSSIIYCCIYSAVFLSLCSVFTTKFAMVIQIIFSLF